MKCVHLFLGSEAALPEIPWDGRRPIAAVRTGDRVELMTREKCACGFALDPHDPELRADEERARQVKAALAQGLLYLQRALTAAGELEVTVDDCRTPPGPERVLTLEAWSRGGRLALEPGDRIRLRLA